MQIDTRAHRARVVAVLGPTNTGKTHLAMERMLGHSSGMIGFPLRLLARENYDRAVAAKGRGQVALITGEEKIVPAGARYFLCTAESMPLDREVAFLGVDEIQMCADPDRGHVFTERLLHARGRDETMFMGADVIKPLLRRLVPDAEFVTRPRLSTLTHTGERKVQRLRPRTAAVAFSAADVYGLAETIRRQRGGAAVVLGALSPRTRNAQVAIYQEGDVDYLVATDAIGMGLNMDVDHVAFAAVRKFDGRVMRALTPPELAQTAGRAGRHMNDGTFGTTGTIGPLDPDLAARIENHEFEPLESLYWRNPRLDFSSLQALQRSLAEPPTVPGLTLAREADDVLALRRLAAEPGIAAMASTPFGLRLLWDVCQVPDFGKVTGDAHARLLAAIYRHLTGPHGEGGRIPTDWLAAQVARLDRADGEIETLAGRIAGIRTWTYVSYHADWVDDARHWQERTRGIEDRLSDALHRGLTQRFVDKRTAILVRRIKDRDELLAAVDGEGRVTVEGHHVGRLDGFRFRPDDGGAQGAIADATEGGARRAVAGATARALRGVVEDRVRRLAASADEAFALAPDAAGWDRRVLWRGAEVARLARGRDPLVPAADVLAGDLLDAPARDRVRARVEAWLGARFEAALEPLFRLRSARLSGAARGLAFQLVEGLGTLPRDRVADQVAALGRDGRRALRGMGVRIGRHAVYVPALLKARAVAMRGLLWIVRDGGAGPPPPEGRVSLALEKDAPEEMPSALYEAMGYAVFGAVALRADMAERLAARLWAASRDGPFAVDAELMSIAGLGPEDMPAVLEGLGYRGRAADDGAVLYRRRRPGRPGRQGARTGAPAGRKAARPAPEKTAAGKAKPGKGPGKPKRPRARKPAKGRGKVDPDSPFAVLRNLKVAR